MGTLLDLINLTLSVTAGHSHGPRPSAPVVVIPMISQQSLGVIEKSDLYEVQFCRDKEIATVLYMHVTSLIYTNYSFAKKITNYTYMCASSSFKLTNMFICLTVRGFTYS